MNEHKTTMRAAFERAEVKPGTDVRVAKRVLRVMHRGAGVRSNVRRNPRPSK